MKVEQAIEQLMNMPLDADIVICAHEWQHESVNGWHVASFQPTTDGTNMVMVEGAYPLDQADSAAVGG